MFGESGGNWPHCSEGIHLGTEESLRLVKEIQYSNVQKAQAQPLDIPLACTDTTRQPRTELTLVKKTTLR
jgi:hypothetical protein